ncbi:MAG: hypothetical protein KGY56_02230 [Desulfobacterales bacterium]|nr:hypothetical protein [Desulfobacterales bacterium]
MKLLSKLNPFDRIMVAVTFAEVNESETARRIISDPETKTRKRRSRKAPEKQATDNRQRLQM